MHRKLRTLAFVSLPLIMAAAILTAPAQAAAWPEKPVRIIIPWAPGGSTDIIGRLLAADLTRRLKQQFIIDNRAGAGSIIGMQLAAATPPDGYNFMLTSTAYGHLINQSMAKGIDYVKSYEPVALLGFGDSALAVHPALPVSSVKELIALAKKRPGELNYSSSGMGAPNHLAMELFTSMTGTKMVHVPYKGAAPSVTDMIGGQVQLGFNAIPSVLQHVQSGKLTAIAVSSAKRAHALPKLPTIAESGVPGFEYNIWYGLFAPSKTPPDLVAKLSGDVQRALKEPEVVQQLVAQGTEPAPTTSAALAQYIREDTARWAKIVKERNIKLE
jgi:tripartite-type tricarboxylate transporter receptor subunit TctC